VALSDVCTCKAFSNNNVVGRLYGTVLAYLTWLLRSDVEELPSTDVRLARACLCFVLLPGQIKDVRYERQRTTELYCSLLVHATTLLSLAKHNTIRQ
jgi:hypothetical protein